MDNNGKLKQKLPGEVFFMRNENVLIRNDAN